MRIREAVEKKKNEKAKEGYVPYIEIGDIDLETKMYSLKEKSAVSGAVMACKGDVLVSTVRPTRGAVTTVQEEMPAVSSAFTILRPNLEVCIPKYLFYCVCSKPFLQHLGANSKGATYPTCSKDDVLDYDFNILGVDGQLDAVNKLDRLYSIIIKRKRQISLLDDLIKARFVEMFGDPKINDKGFTKAPMGEYMTLLTDFSSNGSYKTLDSGVTMYDEPNYAWMVRTTDLESGDMSSIKYIDKKAYELLSKSKIYGGEIIMNKIGSAGKVYLMPEIDMPASLGRNAFMFRFDDRINVRFLFEQLISEYGQAEIQQYVRGAVTKTITKDDARSVKIIVPEKQLQDEYVEFVAQVDKSKVKVKKSLRENQLLFDSLMQRYFG